MIALFIISSVMFLGCAAIWLVHYNSTPEEQRSTLALAPWFAFVWLLSLLLAIGAAVVWGVGA